MLVNGLIATVCMKEAFGLRDALGLVCIAAGVVLVVTQVWLHTALSYLLPLTPSM